MKAASISRCFEIRACKKCYVAIVLGHVDFVKWNHKTIDFGIETSSDERRMKVGSGIISCLGAHASHSG